MPAKISTSQSDYMYAKSVVKYLICHASGKITGTDDSLRTHGNKDLLRLSSPPSPAAVVDLLFLIF